MIVIQREVVENLVQKYEQAWEQQDAEGILEIFTKDALYYERIFEEPFRGHSGIKAYWKNKVVKQQKNINFKLLALYIDGDSAIAEWEVQFDDILQKVRKHMREVAILEIKNNKIASLREYWTSKIIKESD